MNSVVIVADSSFVVETIRLALKNTARLKVLGKVDGRGSISSAVRECQPDIVLVDEMQNSEDCLERIRECRDETPDSTIVLLTMRMDDDWLGDALGAGVDACVSKSSHLPSLGTLIREIVSRNIVCAAPRAAAEAAQPLAAHDDLTAREREILHPRCRRPHERHDRQAAVGHRADGEVPPVEHLPQAGRVESDGGQPLRAYGRASAPAACAGGTRRGAHPGARPQRGRRRLRRHRHDAAVPGGRTPRAGPRQATVRTSG